MTGRCFFRYPARCRFLCRMSLRRLAGRCFFRYPARCRFLCRLNLRRLTGRCFFRCPACCCILSRACRSNRTDPFHCRPVNSRRYRHRATGRFLCLWWHCHCTTRRFIHPWRHCHCATGRFVHSRRCRHCTVRRAGCLLRPGSLWRRFRTGRFPGLRRRTRRATRYAKLTRIGPSTAAHPFRPGGRHRWRRRRRPGAAANYTKLTRIGPSTTTSPRTRGIVIVSCHYRSLQLLVGSPETFRCNSLRICFGTEAIFFLN